ncbi:glycosyltransferase family 2 protein [Spirosoma lituiforme]
MISVVIPLYNAASFLPALLKRLQEQSLEHELILIDSESTDDTRNILNSWKIPFVSIAKNEFNHGTTRNLGAQLAKYDIVMFMTQDALPSSMNTFDYIVGMLTSQDNIAMAYGRQLPYPQTGVFGHFARLTNYPAHSILKDKTLIPRMGIKTCSCSNSFAVYRKSDLEAVGYFPSDTILGEDVSVAARLILQGKIVAYCAEAEVFHSHDYSVVEEFKRYFDIGVFHREQRVVLKEFTQAESEGFKYVLQEWKYLSQNGHIHLIPAQLVRTIAKYIGYRLGSGEQYLPASFKRMLSMHRSFWN